MPYAKAKSHETLAEVITRESPRLSVAEVKAHPKNAGLFTSRTEHMLKDGDPIWLPEEEEEPEFEWVTVKVGSEVKLTVSGKTFKLVLRYPDRTLIKSQPYKLTIDGVLFEGKTSPEGLLEEVVPHKATHGVVSVKGYRQAIEIGALEPIHTAKGIQARLRNLGYAVGPIDGKLGKTSAVAIRRFQRAHNLPVTGVMNPAARKELELQHGC